MLHTETVHDTPAARLRTRGHRFQVALALLMTATVVVGFWPTFFGPLLRGTASRHWILNFHGAVFAGWMVLLLVQVSLAARGRVAAHRRVGTAGIAYGGLVLATGVLISFAAPLLRVETGDWNLDRAGGFLIIPLGDMVLFGGFFGAAVAYRRRPEIHKRLILLATVALLFAAVGRMEGFLPVPAMLAVWLAPVLAAIGYDLAAFRRVHPVNTIGLAMLLAGLLRLPLEQSPAWIALGRSMLEALR
jgi:hypothetical protein